MGDSGEQDLELYTEIALNYRSQILGIFIRDVTTPLLQPNSANSSTVSLTTFSDGNGQPVQRKEGRLAQLRGLRDTLRGKSTDTLPTLTHFPTTSSSRTPQSEEDDPLSMQQAKDLERLALNDIEVLSPFMNADQPGAGTLDDLPLQKSKTPPPTRPSVARIMSSTSLNSEPNGFDFSARSSTEKTVVEDPSSRVKKVEIWKRRLARARERLLLSEVGVEIWTWRVGGDVDHICETLILKALDQKKHEGNGVMSRDMGVQPEKHISIQ